MGPALEMGSLRDEMVKLPCLCVVVAWARAEGEVESGGPGGFILATSEMRDLSDVEDTEISVFDVLFSSRTLYTLLVRCEV